MNELSVRTEGRIGWITLTRPDALNALTAGMLTEIERSLDSWLEDASVELAVIDAAGQRAFCAGGDIVEMHRSGVRGDLEYGRRFWRNEYRLNAKLANSKIPVVTFLQGFTMGGGVGIGCHARHRIVGESSRIAMPECAIGLVPDVGGSYLLSKAPGRIGECMGVSGYRAGPADAILAGLADVFVPEDDWRELKLQLAASGDANEINKARKDPPVGQFPSNRDRIDRIFSGSTVPDIVGALRENGSQLAETCLKSIARHSPLSMACALKLIRLQRDSRSIEDALALEYRYVHRSVEQADFLEGIRALVIDKDNRPNWRHSSPSAVGAHEVDALLGPIGEHELKLEVQG